MQARRYLCACSTVIEAKFLIKRCEIPEHWIARKLALFSTLASLMRTENCMHLQGRARMGMMCRHAIDVANRHEFSTTRVYVMHACTWNVECCNVIRTSRRTASIHQSMRVKVKPIARACSKGTHPSRTNRRCESAAQTRLGEQTPPLPLRRRPWPTFKQLTPSLNLQIHMMLKRAKCTTPNDTVDVCTRSCRFRCQRTVHTRP